MNHASFFVVSLLGFALFAAAMHRHQESLFGQPLAARISRMLRAGGSMGLLAALVIAVRSYGWSLGLVAYSGHTSATAALVFLALVYWGRRKPP